MTHELELQRPQPEPAAIAHGVQGAVVRGEGRFEIIQVLRAYAAWLVVVHHFHQIFNHADRSTAWGRALAECGHYAVYVFFVISGFIIHHALTSKPRTGFDFLVGRIKRIGPPYWIATVVFTLLLFAFLGDKVSGMWNAKAMAMSMIFVAYPHPSGYGDLPILPVGWSLNFEVFFYALVAIALYAFKARWFAVLFWLLMLLPWAWPADWPYAQIVADPVLMLFAAGMALDRFSVFKGNWSSTGSTAWSVGLLTVLIASLLLMSAYALPQLAKIGLALLLVVCALQCSTLVNMQLPGWRHVVRLGDWSYSTYLIHLIILYVIEKSAFMPFMSNHKWWSFAAYVVLVCVGSKFYNRYIEGIWSEKRRDPVFRSQLLGPEA